MTFCRVLIANRGEIAVRVMQTCREMGLETIAIYSSADAEALHVRFADEAYLVGPPPALESYLNIEAILEAAVRSGAEAVHPGYGFLAENPQFARRVQENGLVWIGPAPRVIELLGDKVAAKELAREHGVPVIPGYFGEDQSEDRLYTEAEQIGYPLMIKAAAGGGGKGMRAVRDSQSFQLALESAKREARSAFADDRVFLERLLVAPRHIEIQILLDTHGNGVYLGERDCSAQRRHQKVVEEAPSPVLTDDLRRAMGEDALRVARAAGYENAGTVEFLFSNDRYYFLEVNTRIQVEHAVTELVTGLDLVRLQLHIAAGERLSFDQSAVQLRGHAIEVRLYAEDPSRGFLPATGRLAVYDMPFGPGIRNDTGVYAGAEITPYYDPMLAKLIVHAPDRQQALARMRQALERYAILGTTSNLDFLRWIIGSPDFQHGRVDTEWIDRTWHPDVQAIPARAYLIAAAYEVIQRGGDETRKEAALNPWSAGSAWRVAGSERRFSYEGANGPVTVFAVPLGGTSWRLWVEELAVDATLTPQGTHTVVLQSEHDVISGTIAVDGQVVSVQLDGGLFRLERQHAPEAEVRAGRQGDSSGLSAPMPGTVVKVHVRPGQRVEEGEPLVVLEAMKMEHIIQAPASGTIVNMPFDVGDMVPAGAEVLQLRSEA